MEHEEVKNNSKVYLNGSKWKTNNCGEITIIGKSNKITLDAGRNRQRHFIIMFKDGYIKEANQSTIKKGAVRNPYEKSIFGIGFAGEGKYKVSVKSLVTKEYYLWHSMMERCYSEGFHLSRPSYKDCLVNERWHNFQNFCEDIKDLDGYKDWENDDDNKNNYALDKDIKIKGNKVYSKNTCLFVTGTENTIFSSLTGKIFKGTSKDGEKCLFNNISEFSREHKLSISAVSNCIRKKRSCLTCKGWTFKVVTQQGQTA